MAKSRKRPMDPVSAAWAEIRKGYDDTTPDQLRAEEIGIANAMDAWDRAPGAIDDVDDFHLGLYRRSAAEIVVQNSRINTIDTARELGLDTELASQAYDFTLEVLARTSTNLTPRMEALAARLARGEV